jgi:hypothetical protein
VEQERDYDRPPVGVSGKEQLLTLLGLFAFIVGLLYLGITIGHRPFGIYLIVFIGYTALTFYQVFCDSRAFKGYSLRLSAVRRKLPVLVAIHLGFLFLVLVGLNAVVYMHSSVRPYRPFGPDDWVALSLMVSGVLICMGETMICRGILRRSLAADRERGSIAN